MSTGGQFHPNNIPITNIHTNVAQSTIFITEDKLNLCLRDHLDSIQNRSKWQFPAGVALALIPVLLTSDFRDLFGIKKEFIEAVFWVATLWSVFHTLLSLIKNKNASTLEILIQNIKNVQAPPSAANIASISQTPPTISPSTAAPPSIP